MPVPNPNNSDKTNDGFMDIVILLASDNTTKVSLSVMAIVWNKASNSARVKHVSGPPSVRMCSTNAGLTTEVPPKKRLRNSTTLSAVTHISSSREEVPLLSVVSVLTVHATTSSNKKVPDYSNGSWICSISHALITPSCLVSIKAMAS